MYVMYKITKGLLKFTMQRKTDLSISVMRAGTSMTLMWCVTC